MTRPSVDELIASILTFREERIRFAERPETPIREIASPEVLAVEPLVSVEVVTYNHEAWLERCVESVVAQVTDFPFEIIIGVDASKDGTLEVAKALQARHPGLIRLIVPERNVGLLQNAKNVRKAMRGTYAALLEGDDWWLPGKLQRQVDTLRAHPECAFCFSTEYRFFEPDGLRREFVTHFPKRQDSMCRRILEWTCAPHTSTVLCKTADLLEVGREADFFSNAFLVQDSQLFTLLARKGPVWCDSEPLAVRRYAAATMTGDHWTEFRWMDQVLTLLLPRFQERFQFSRHALATLCRGRLTVQCDILANKGYSKAEIRAILAALYAGIPYCRLGTLWHLSPFYPRWRRTRRLRHLFQYLLFPIRAHRHLFASRPATDAERRAVLGTP